MALSSPLPAAAPVPQEIVASPASLGQAMTIYARATDADSNLSQCIFQYRGPNLQWNTIATVNISGGDAWAQTNWVPFAALGPFDLRVQVKDATNNVTTSATASGNSFQGTLVANATIGSGQTFDVFEIFDIRTQLDPRPSSFNVQIQSGGDAIFWSRDRVVLGPGFRASSGSRLIAAVDSNVNGYSDAEEAIDTDGDGLWDAWELDHAAYGFSITNPADAAGDYDGDGTSNVAEFLAGRNPFDASDAQPMPTGHQLVLKVPESSYLKVNTTSWAIAPAP